jgi:glycosyltransferase involved in cell wall biosynthesis
MLSMLSMLKISIITPSYNQANFIGQTIKSVLDQKGPFELELIVIDGGSTDGTVDILRGFGQSIKWISEKDAGQADALNKGLSRATGDIIGWVNSDDLYQAGALASVAEVFAAQPAAQWVYGKVRIVDARGMEIRRWITGYKNWAMRRYSYPRLLAENWISQMGVFWRRSAWLAVGPFRTDLHYCMDYNYWLRLGARWPGIFIDKYLAAFRWYPSSKSGAGFGRQFKEELEVATQAAGGKYPLAIFKHRLNFAKIVAAYSMMQAFRPAQKD